MERSLAEKKNYSVYQFINIELYLIFFTFRFYTKQSINLYCTFFYYCLAKTISSGNLSDECRERRPDDQIR